ncbi:MAG: elongator complex protein 3 [Acidobacteriota bacterium]
MTRSSTDPSSAVLRPRRFRFDPRDHEDALVGAIEMIRARGADLDERTLQHILRRHPRSDKRTFRKSELIRGFRALAPRYGWRDEADFLARVRAKPIRTRSGVAPVTVLTKPFPCPGRCIFCPSDVRMPKSYLSREPGAQRAAQHRFDPYAQTLARLLAYHHNGHPIDKVELIVLGGTWSFYPEPYQIWFILRCFEALNDFDPQRGDDALHDAVAHAGREAPIDFDQLDETVDGAAVGRDLDDATSYNQVVGDFLRRRLDGRLRDQAEHATWDALARAQQRNERTIARCVGLVLETRPDHLDPGEADRLRRLGATKVQIGIQSLSDAVLAANHRGHDVAATRRAFALMRGAGFKLHAHWMPNLYGSDPQADIADFHRLFDDPAIRPDELKIYPCSLLPSAELVRYHRDGRWRPYSRDELLEVLTHCLAAVPPYCRVTRVIRDIPGDDILVGNKTTNFRQLAEQALAARGTAMRDIRAREIRERPVADAALRFDDSVRYRTPVGEELFLQMVTADDHLCGFLRLALPAAPPPDGLDELADRAIVREVHVYGALVGLAGDPAEAHAQHRGLGRALMAHADRIAAARGYAGLAVISAVGTRDYYRRLGYRDGHRYQLRDLNPDPSLDAPGPREP